MNAIALLEKVLFTITQHVRNNSQISPQRPVINYLANGTCLFADCAIAVLRDHQRKLNSDQSVFRSP